MKIAGKELGLTIMIDSQQYVVVCTKNSILNPGNCIYVTPRDLYGNADNGDYIHLYMTCIKKHVVKLCYTQKGKKELITYQSVKKDNLIEIE